MPYVTVAGLSSGLYVPISVTGTLGNIQIKVTQPSPQTLSPALPSTSGYTTTLTGWNAQNGTVIDIAGTSSSEYATQLYATLQIGSASSTWYITTGNAPNNAPNPPPSFLALTDLALNTDFYSGIYQVAGLSASATAAVTGNGGNGTTNTARIGKSSSAALTSGGILSGATFTSSSISVTNGEYIQLRQLSSTFSNTEIITTLTLGTGLPANWSITTGNPPDTTLNPFNFTNVTSATTGQEYPSLIGGTNGQGGTIYTVAGIATGVTLQVTLTSSKLTNSGGIITTPLSPLPRVQVNNGSIGTFPVDVVNGDSLRIWMYAGANFSDTTEAQIQVGDYSPNPWKIINSATPDTTPDPIAFVSRINRPPSTVITSNAVSLTGFQGSITVTTTNSALISRNGGTYVSSPVTVVEGDTISLQLTSSASLNATVSTSVTAGSLAAVTWSVSTYAVAPTTEVMISQWYSRIAVMDADERLEMKQDGLAIGTVLPITKFQDGDWGNLDGGDDSRYPGFMECDGRSLSAATYFELFKSIENTYGGNGAYVPASNSYTGNFKLPNYRNRKLVGVGGVDGNNAASVSVTTYKGSDPTSSSTGDSNLAGSSGGNWIIDTIDSQGARPPEQVYDGAPNDVDGPFFVLGAIRTTGYTGINQDVDFNIGANGFISGTVGPLEDAITKIGQHTHQMLTGVSGDEDISYIGWGVPSYGGAGQEANSGGVPGEWIADRPSPADDLYGAPFTSSTETYGWWWRSPKSSTPVLDNSAGEHLAMIDSSDTNATVDPYDPGVFGGALNHSHYLAEKGWSDPKTEYAWGNISGSGTQTSELASISNTTNVTTLGNTLTVRFNQSQLQITANTSKFQLSSAKQINPTVNLSPQKKIPIMNKYFRVKYIIKVY